MTDEEKTAQDCTFDISSCMEMMEKMTRLQTEGCDCIVMLSLLSDKDVVSEVQKKMSQMEPCCRIGKEA